MATTKNKSEPQADAREEAVLHIMKRVQRWSAGEITLTELERGITKIIKHLRVALKRRLQRRKREALLKHGEAFRLRGNRYLAAFYGGKVAVLDELLFSLFPKPRKGGRERWRLLAERKRI